MPFETTVRVESSVPTTTFAHVTHVLSPTTLWDARAGRMAYTQSSIPAAGNLDVTNRFDRFTGVSSGGPQSGRRSGPHSNDGEVDDDARPVATSASITSGSSACKWKRESTSSTTRRQRG